MSAMTLIESKTLGTAAASIEFTSIPQTYTDLVVLLSLRGNTTSGEASMIFNSTSSSWSSKHLYGDGSSAASNNNPYAPSVLYLGGVSHSNHTANTFGNQLVYIPNYAGSTNKSVSVDSVMENNATYSLQNLLAGLWSDTAAINSITIGLVGGASYAVGSTVSLYGVLKGSDGIVTTS